MKLPFRIIIAVLFALNTLPYAGFAAISIQHQVTVQSSHAGKSSVPSVKNRLSFKEKIGRKIAKFKQRVQHWWDNIQLSFPSGKLLTTLILLVLSIVFFAVGGAVTLGVLFNILGSAAVIGALVFFVLWLSERNAGTSTGN